MQPKRPASVVIDSATYLLTISSEMFICAKMYDCEENIWQLSKTFYYMFSVEVRYFALCAGIYYVVLFAQN